MDVEASPQSPPPPLPQEPPLLAAAPDKAEPCAACGCAFLWLSPLKKWSCPECVQVPAVAAMVRQRISLVYDAATGASRWVDFDFDRQRRGHFAKQPPTAWRKAAR